MKEINFTVSDPNGIHARPAGILVKTLKNYASKVVLFKDGRTCDMKKLLALMSMDIEQGDSIKIQVIGDDEDACAKVLEETLKENS